MLGRGLEESRRGEAESLNVRDKIVCNPRIREEGEAILEQKKKNLFDHSTRQLPGVRARAKAWVGLQKIEA